jgi:hypothetical protein
MLLANNIPKFQQSLNQCIKLILIQNSVVQKVNHETNKI